MVLTSEVNELRGKVRRLTNERDNAIKQNKRIIMSALTSDLDAGDMECLSNDS